MAVRWETSSQSEINFSIVEVIDNTNRHDNIYSEINDELSDFKNDKIQQTIQRISGSDSIRKTTTEQLDRWRQEYTSNGRVSKKPRFLSG